MPDIILPQIDEFASPLRLDMSRLALTLAAYQRKHGRHPDSLDQLTPDWIDAIPVDRFSGQPLHYQRRDQGAVLYSVGQNQIDDNGVGEHSSQRTGNKDDICVTLLK